MYQKNPFSLAFGRKPAEYVERYSEITKIVNTFTQPPVTEQIFVITGVRGSGKTVFLNACAKEFEEKKDWKVIRLLKTESLIDSLCGDICQLIGAEYSLEFSAPFMKADIRSGSYVRTSKSIIEKYLKELSAKNRNLLIVLDEVVNTQAMREFASLFQLLVGEDLPVYLLCTALYENIYSLQNEKDLTFLYRASKIPLDPLIERDIALTYGNVLDIEPDDANYFAEMTRGYAFAVQALGYAFWNVMRNVSNDKWREYETGITDMYFRILSERSYDKMWQEMPENEKKICQALTVSMDKNPWTILHGAMSRSDYLAAKDQLTGKGIIDREGFADITLSLPLFGDYVKENSEK